MICRPSTKPKEGRGISLPAGGTSYRPYSQRRYVLYEYVPRERRPDTPHLVPPAPRARVRARAREATTKGRTEIEQMVWCCRYEVRPSYRTCLVDMRKLSMVLVGQEDTKEKKTRKG